MPTDQKLEEIVRRVIAQLGAHPPAAEERARVIPDAPAGGENNGKTVAANRPSAEPGPVEEAEIPDVRAVDYRDVYAVPHPANPEEFMRMKKRTWARLGQGRAGSRYTTAAQLRFWADQAAAQDAVFTDVEPEWLKDAGLFQVQTKCTSKDDYLTNPERGAQFSKEAIAELKQRCQANPQVQVFVADGLSSTAVQSNVVELLPALEQGLQLHGLAMGTPFFVKFGRVRSMEPIAEALNAEVICVLVGNVQGWPVRNRCRPTLPTRRRSACPRQNAPACPISITRGRTRSKRAPISPTSSQRWSGSRPPEFISSYEHRTSPSEEEESEEREAAAASSSKPAAAK